jgi:hypothetical protein
MFQAIYAATGPTVGSFEQVFFMYNLAVLAEHGDISTTWRHGCVLCITLERTDIETGNTTRQPGSESGPGFQV